jgi:hypothetical protein
MKPRARERQSSQAAPQSAGSCEPVPYVAELYRKGATLNLPLLTVRAESAHAAAEQVLDWSEESDIECDEVRVRTLH